MSSKTEILGFDEYWNDQKKNGFIPTFSDVASNAFEAGQQSKQVEINDLKWMLKNSNGQADDFCRRSIELQKRIDNALMWCEKGCVLKAMEILKGDQS